MDTNGSEQPGLTAAESPRSWTTKLPTPGNSSALYLLATVLIISAVWVPDVFFTSATFKSTLSSQVTTALLALALLVPFIAGAFDLSVGNMAAFSLVIISWLGINTELHWASAAALAILACGCVGLIAGIVTVVLRVNSFIATLGVSQVLLAATLYISKNRQITGAFSNDFLSVGRGNWMGVPKLVFYLVAIALILWFVLEWTPAGRKLFAVGSNVEAARLAGIRTRWYVLGSLVASAMIAGLAGVLYGSQAGTFSSSFGPPLLFPAFTAVFFGATQFKKTPNVWGTVVALYALAFGIVMLQLGLQDAVYWITPLFNGSAMLIAVTLAARGGRVKIRTLGQSRAAAVVDEAVPVAAAPNTDSLIHSPDREIARDHETQSGALLPDADRR